MRRLAARFDFELLNGIRKRQRHVGAGHEVVVIGAIQTVVGPERSATADADVVQVGEQRTACLARHHARSSESDEIHNIAPVERQFHNALVLDNLAHAGTTGLDKQIGRAHV